MKKIIYLLIFLSVGNVISQDSTSSFGAQVDQDFFGPNNDDRNYTMGLRLHYDSYHLDNLFPFKQIKKSLSKNDESNKTITFKNNSVSFYFGGFTPDSIGTQSIVEGDRPFANVAGISLGGGFNTIKTGNGIYKGTSVEKNNYRFTYYNFSIGIIGSGLAEPLQGWFHKRNKNYKDTILNETPLYPFGWKNQISNGGVITGLFQFGQDVLLTKRYLSSFLQKKTNNKGWVSGERERLNYFQRHVQVKSGYQVMLGYYNNLQLNTEIRFGFINPNRWSFLSSNNDQYNSKKKSKVKSKPNCNKSKKDFELYLFGAAKGNFMFYNAFLRGQILTRIVNSTDPYTLQRNEVQQLFMNYRFGAALRVKGVFLSYAPIVIRTSEIKAITGFKRRHQWGEIRLVFTIKNPKTKNFKTCSDS